MYVDTGLLVHGYTYKVYPRTLLYFIVHGPWWICVRNTRGAGLGGIKRAKQGTWKEESKKGRQEKVKIKAGSPARIYTKIPYILLGLYWH